MEYERACEERLASARPLSEAREQMQRAGVHHQEERSRMQQQITELHDLLRTLGSNITAPRTAEALESATTTTVEPTVSRREVTTETETVTVDSRRSSSSELPSDEDHLPTVPTECRQPPAFKDLRSRLDKFSGKSGEGDFEIWLEDYSEATQNCGWSDEQRARWFSWFITGPAKITWQRTLTSEDKLSWERIKTVYKAQYGIHIDPRTAYQHCQELLYEQFNSVQGLMTAMREYQQMAPTMLTDAVMESILWNKVPVALQQEVKELSVGNVQVLLQKLLRAESVVQERSRRFNKEQRGHPSTPRKARDRPAEPSDPTPNKGGTEPCSDPIRRPDVKREDGNAEMGQKKVKCFKCRQRGHIALHCPQAKKEPNTRRVTTEDESQPVDPWVLSVTAKDDSGSSTDTSHLRGPAYKVIVQVEGVRTRALIDFGAQVTLVRSQMLLKIKEKCGWTIEECHSRNKPLEQQPVGAGGEPLGAEAVVALNVEVEATKVTKEVLCFVLDSSKPLWKGELTDCGLVLGTNSLRDLGFEITQPNGTAVDPQVTGEGEKIATTDSLLETSSTDTPPSETVVQPVSVKESEMEHQISLCKNLRLGPRQTQIAKVQVNGELLRVFHIGRVCPSKELEGQQCDLTEGLWERAQEFEVPVTNWGPRPIMFTKDTVVGKLEAVELVTAGDPVWKEQSDLMVATISGKNVACQRKEQLAKQLCIGEHSTEDKAAVQEAVLSHHSVFAVSDEELGETNLVEHEIKLTDNTTITTPPRRLPYALRTELEEELERLLNTGCIEPSTSPYSSGLVLVRKKDGSLRVCVDYRALNRVTVPDRYPMPRIDELIDTVGKCQGKYFTSLDLMKGYHQVKMAEGSKEKTAFTCHQGLFQYRRMPFGLTNAPATFQRLMATLFAGQEWSFVFVYLDDLLVVSKSIEEHVEHLGKVFQRLEEANLKLKPQKCKFAQEKIEYLGHTLTAEGVCPNDGKIQAVIEFPRPQTIKEVKSFLGLVNYYRRHLRNLAVIARPLTALTRKGKCPNQVDWTEECEKAFNKVKELLTHAPMLHPPDLSKPFFLSTDASERGFGAVLEQEGEDKKRYPIAYASRQTNPAEQKYAPTELEVAALVFAVGHFEVYLLGNKVTVYTDHQALVSAFVSHLKSQTRGLLARWYLKLSRFLPQLELQYKPGNQNTAADALSRAPVRNCDVRAVTTSDEEDGTLVRVCTEQKKDRELSQLINYLESKQLPEDAAESKVIVNAANHGYFVLDGVLYYESADTPGRRRLVVPAHLREAVLNEAHDPVYAGHFSAKKLIQKLSLMYHWPGMRGDAHKKSAACVTCASIQGQGRRTKPPLHSIPVGGPFHCIGMDFKEMDQSKRGNRYALVFQDYLSKWPEVYAVSDRKATTVAQCLADFIWRHGVPVQIIHDRAAEFLSDVLQETAEVLGVTQLPTSGGHPQTDGMVERLNRTLKQMLSKIVSKGGRDWDDQLGAVLFAYRTAPHASTGMTPFSLVYGRDPRVPTSLNCYQPVYSTLVLETEFAKELFQDLREARKLAQRNIKKAQHQQKQGYDKSAVEPTIKVDDLVMLKVEPRFKLDRTYKGPYRVIEVTSTNAVIRPVHDPLAEPWNVSLQRLSKCSVELAAGTPWFGHGKSRKRRKIKRTSGDSNQQVTQQAKEVDAVVSRKGRRILPPARYRRVAVPQGPAKSDGGSCKITREITRAGRTTRDTCEKRRGTGEWRAT